MKVPQIAGILNDVFAELTGSLVGSNQHTPEGEPVPVDPEDPSQGYEKYDKPLFNEDLSNFIDVGTKIFATTEWQNHYDNYWGSIIDHIGKTIVVDKDYQSMAPALEVDSSEYGSVLEKVRVGEVEFQNNPAWDLVNSKNADNPDAWIKFNYLIYSPVELKSTYWNSKVSMMCEWSWAGKQLKESVLSKNVLMRIFSAIENKIRTKKKIETDGLKMRLINNINAVNIFYGRQINLLARYIDVSDDSEISAANALINKEFLRFCVVELKKWKKFMGIASKNLNTKNELNWTQNNSLRMVAITDFDSALGAYLSSDTYHDNFVAFDGYTEVGSWQGIDRGYDYDIRSAIWAEPALGLDADGEVITTNPIQFSGIVFTMFDKDGAVIYNEEPDTETAPFNPKGKFLNYYYTYDCSYLQDLAENSVTFVISDYEVLPSGTDTTGLTVYGYDDETGELETVTAPETIAPSDVGKYLVKIAGE